MKQAKEFEKSSIILFCIMMGGNVCNYLFQIIVGNLMSVEDYGVVNTVLAIVALFSIPTTIITMISARYMALNVDLNRKEPILSTLHFLYKMVALIGAMVLVVGGAFGGSIAQAFGLESDGFVYGALIIVLFNLAYSITSGSLQGLKKFTSFGLQGFIVALVKLIGSVLLVILGCRIYGVLVAIVIGTVLAIFFSMKDVGTELAQAIRYRGESVIDLREFVAYALGTIVSQCCVTILTNGDILMVKYYFTEREAGVYSSAMVIGKIAMYVSTAVVATLFPMVVEKHERGEDTMPLLRKAMLYGGGMSIVCATGMILLGKYVIGILFGQKYLDAIGYLPFVCAYVVPLTFLTVFMNYFLATGKANLFAVLSGGVLIAVFVGCLLAHENIGKMMLICGVILLLADIALGLYSFLKNSIKK